MKNIRIILAFVVCFFIFTACGDNTVADTDINNSTALTVEERKDIFASYFNHNVQYKIGRFVGESENNTYTVNCDGQLFNYRICKEENLGFYHPMTGSLDYNLPLEEGEEMIVFYINGENGINYAKTVSPTTLSDKYTRIFFESETAESTSPRGYYKNMQKHIRTSLDKIENPQVLTLDEALNVFWKESGLSKKDFLQKTGVHGDVFYQHKTEDHAIMATVNLLCTQAEGTDGLANVDKPQDYEFVIIQNKGENYIINVDGTVTKTEGKIHGIYK